MHEAGFVEPLARMLTGDDAHVRARLIASMVAGLMYSLWIAQDDGLLQAEPGDIIDTYGKLLQSLIDG